MFQRLQLVLRASEVGLEETEARPRHQVGQEAVCEGKGQCRGRVQPRQLTQGVLIPGPGVGLAPIVAEQREGAGEALQVSLHGADRDLVPPLRKLLPELWRGGGARGARHQLQQGEQSEQGVGHRCLFLWTLDRLCASGATDDVADVSDIICRSGGIL